MNMVREIVHDPFFLGMKSEPASENDRQVMTDLLDTLRANLDRCVGMAANMIGVRKRIIVFCFGPVQTLMVNPQILEKSGTYQTEEGCLSLDGTRKTTRFRNIEVEYTDIGEKKQRHSYSGQIAQIIQHECDHLDGVII